LPETSSGIVPQSRVVQLAAVLAMLFGVATLVSGGRVLFGPAAARLAAGSYVPFVLWFNFLAGFAYIVVGAALLAKARWAAMAAVTIAAASLIVGIALGLHVLGGGAYELRTVVAMTVRTSFWVFVAAVGTRRPRRVEGLYSHTGVKSNASRAWK